MRVYVSGPMTGIQNLNRQSFLDGCDLLARDGHEPVDPGAGEKPDQSWEQYLRADLIEMLGCDGVAILPGWVDSRGARLEVDVAYALSMPVREVDDWEPAEGVAA